MSSTSRNRAFVEAKGLFHISSCRTPACTWVGRCFMLLSPDASYLQSRSATISGVSDVKHMQSPDTACLQIPKPHHVFYGSPGLEGYRP